MWLGVALALFYLIYLVIVVPAAALAAAVTYGLGVPVRYFMALGRVLVVRPPQSWVMSWPLGKVSVTVQPVVAVLPVLVTDTWPWNAPCQLPTWA